MQKELILSNKGCSMAATALPYFIAETRDNSVNNSEVREAVSLKEIWFGLS